MQSSATLEELIASHPFLAGLEKRFLGLLEPCASIRRFGAHQRIFLEGSEAEHFYLINSGKIVLEAEVSGNRTVPIQILGPGDALGWSWLFPPYKWRFSASSLMPTEVLSFAAGFLRERADEDLVFENELLRRIGKTMIERMQVIRQGLVALSSSTSQVGSETEHNVGSYMV